MYYIYTFIEHFVGGVGFILAFKVRVKNEKKNEALCQHNVSKFLSPASVSLFLPLSPSLSLPLSLSLNFL